MIDPRTVMLAIPCYDGKVMSETAGALQSCQGLFAAVSMPTECSHVSLVRNIIAGQFLASTFEWLVCVDSDIAFHRRDLEILLEPCDTSVAYLEDASEGSSRCGAQHPRPTRTTLALTVDGQPGGRIDYAQKMLGAADVLVCAEYSFKNDALAPVRLGMGFVRIHRSVFETLQQLKHDGGPTVEVQRHCMERLKEARAASDVTADTLATLKAVDELLASVEDKAGTARLWQTTHKGRLYTDFYPSGPILSQFVPTAEWKGEDHGFFTLCMLAGIIPRIETRTRLMHIGRKGYPYLGPDVGGGQ